MLDESLKMLKKYYGYEEFREGQFDIIKNILNLNDVLAIMPTGGGKSICYQIPALMMDGTVLVISPLISLMKDQVDTLNQMGINSAYINSSLSLSELRHIIFQAQNNEYKLLYVAPERLESEKFIEMLKNVEISMIAIDEAHCVSQWGHDFRQSYLKIKRIREFFDYRPVFAAFTATATDQVKKDIINLIGLSNHYEKITGFDRENLKFQVEKPIKKFSYILNYIEENKGKSGIIYCLTRKVTDDICNKLIKAGYKATNYHAGLSDDERNKNQNDFLYDNKDIMVCTNAFGMGIDKSNIRYVIHYNMPKNIESYYQEAGRAGRDREASDCILLFSPSDIMMNNYLIESSIEISNKAKEYVKLRQMINYCNTDKCLRKYLISYFSKDYDKETCNNCSNCLSDIEISNITVEAQKILSCIYRTGERFGSNMIIDVLKGSNNKRVKEFNFDKLSTFQIMKDYKREDIKEIVSYLIAEGYISINDDKFSVLKISSMGNSVLRGKQEVSIKKRFIKENKNDKLHDDEEVKNKEYDKELFQELRILRKEIADKSNIPPFIVFSDASLKDMCIKFPVTRDEFLQVSGVGDVKADRYGEKFIFLIKKYLDEK